MSSALAIASVTRVLKDLLNDGVIDHDISGAVGGNVTVSALPPDRIDVTPANTESRLNLFMYQAVPNTGWNNIGFPSRNSRGDRITNPPLALNLHYLLTAYGADELHSEILLGFGMQLLHETPVLSREAIRTSLAPPTDLSTGGLPPELLALSTSGLADQIEQIKIVPMVLNIEELSKLWTTFESKYRPTAAYMVSVVLIQSNKSTRVSLPVRAPIVYVVPFENPVIEKIWSQSADDQPIIENQTILENYNLVIRGHNLRSGIVLVNIAGINVIPDDNNIKDDEIIVPLPTGLKAGIQGVQVIHQRLMGSPPEPHQGVQSNVEAFILSPQIENITIANIQGAGEELRSANIELQVTPDIQESQKVILLLNEFIPGNATVPSHAYSFQATPLALASPPAPPDTIIFQVSNVVAGDYLVRVMIDGALSPLNTDSNGKYNAPQVAIT
ncbi:MAG TPA: DUF4255 domain-containing protein [Mariniphaga sp.]|nr:DUF4255 domain-containing protein [Mariniphaga sp.]